MVSIITDQQCFDPIEALGHHPFDMPIWEITGDVVWAEHFDDMIVDAAEFAQMTRAGRWKRVTFLGSDEGSCSTPWTSGQRSNFWGGAERAARRERLTRAMVVWRIRSAKRWQGFLRDRRRSARFASDLDALDARQSSANPRSSSAFRSRCRSRLTSRQTAGMAAGLRLAGLTWSIPGFGTPCRRQKDLGPAEIVRMARPQPGTGKSRLLRHFADIAYGMGPERRSDGPGASPRAATDPPGRAAAPDRLPARARSGPARRRGRPPAREHDHRGQRDGRQEDDVDLPMP